MKKLKLSMVVLLVMVVFSGCAKTINLTDEETDMFAEYISMEVLARDKHYDQELLTQVYDSENAADESTETTNNLEANDKGQQKEDLKESSTSDTIPTDTEDKKIQTATVSEILSQSTIQVSYNSAELYKSYPKEDSYFIISANDGYQLLVLTFDLKNNSDKSVTYNMLDESVEYKLALDGGNSYSPLLTLLVDDLQFVNKVIPGNKTEQGVLVFRIPEKEENQKRTLTIADRSKSATMEIK